MGKSIKFFISIVIVLVLVCLAYFIYDYFHIRTINRETFFPHSGQSLILQKACGGSDCNSMLFTLNDSVRNASFGSYVGVRIGAGCILDYSDENISYKFSRSVYTGTGDFIRCIRGACEVFASNHSFEGVCSDGSENDYNGYRRIVCFPNNTYYNLTRQRENATSSFGLGCPG